MDYLGELVWRKENKKYLIISMKKLINVYLKFSYMTGHYCNKIFCYEYFFHSVILCELTATFES